MDSAEQTEQTRRFFEKAASGWAARYDSDAAIHRRKDRFLEAVSARYPQSADVLDFGCGSGDITLYLAGAGHRLTGYDLSPAMIGQAVRADRDRIVRWASQASDVPDILPFADASFDVVVASSVLEYVAELDLTLRQIARVLRPGGWLFATVPDMRDHFRRRERWLQLVLAIPGMTSLLSRSRWSEGVAYLRISTNRMTPETWRCVLNRSGLDLEDFAETTDPLLLLAACKA